MLEENLLNKNIFHARPKSKSVYGLRIKFAEFDPMQLELVAKAACELYPEMICAEPKYLKGFIDISFKTEEIAAEAAKVCLNVNNRLVPICRTCFAHDENILIAYED